MKLSKRTIEDVVPISKPIMLWDDQIPGFGVKVLPKGLRKYLVKYRTLGGGRKAPQRWLTLGTHGAITCDQARELARQALAQVAAGEDPQGDKQTLRQSATLGELWSRFEQEQLPLKKPGTARDYRHLWAAVIEPALGRQPVRALTRQHTDRLHKSLQRTPYQANRTLALLSRLLNLAEAWGLIPQGSNPARYVEKYKEQARERYLKLEEIRRISGALDELVQDEKVTFEAAAAIRLLLLTGARRNEVITARWEWVDDQARVIALPDSKTGKKPIFLSAEALLLIAELRDRQNGKAEPYLFPGRVAGKSLYDLKGPWRLICDRAGLAGVRIHDLRHTAASIAVNSGASLPVIGRLLGHRQAQTTQRYAHVDTDPALVAANQIGAAIGNALGISDARQRAGEGRKAEHLSHTVEKGG